jgi:hypothetical protein
MSRQPVRPRAIHEHEATAHAVLGHYARVAGWVPQLPVPVEQIIERCHGAAHLLGAVAGAAGRDRARSTGPAY